MPIIEADNLTKVAWAGPFVAAVLFFIAYRVWLFRLRYYSGTGS